MEEKELHGSSLIHRLSSSSGAKLIIAVLAVSVLAGLGSGYYLASSSSGTTAIPLVNQKPKAASQDTQTFKDFAEGKLTKKPEDKKNQSSEGTHLLIRDGAVPVTLTSSVVDLSQYENKKVKVFGQTYDNQGGGWFMDVGKVEEVK